MKKDLEKNFRDPGSEFRGKPFCAWNSGLDHDELREQIGYFRDMEFGAVGEQGHAFFGGNIDYETGIDLPAAGDAEFEVSLYRGAFA